MSKAEASLQLSFMKRDDLPALAWCLEATSGFRQVTLWHGPRVETSASAFVEGAWDGAFSDMAMDQSVCMGSGGRIADGKLILSTPSHTLEALYSVRVGDRLIVSNSLAFTLVRAGLDLDPRYTRYLIDMRSIMRGLQRHVKVIPTQQGVAVQRHFFCNLVIDTSLQVRQESKPRAPRFKTFAEYREYLRSGLERIAANANDSKRSFVYRLLTTVSRGYDSPAVAVFAKECGCKRAMTINDSSWGNPIDSGREIGELLFDEIIERKRRDYFQNPGIPEAEFAALGDAGDVPFSSFEDVLAGAILTTGFPNAWDPQWSMGSDVRRHDASGSSLGEFRLRVGFVHVPLPFVGCENHADISAIGRLPEFDPWRVGGRYDRPIARRIAEVGGVPRHMFGQRKSAAATWWTLSRKPESKTSYENFRTTHRRAPVIESFHSFMYWSSRRWIFLKGLAERAVGKLGVHLEIPQIVPLRFTEPADEAHLVQWGMSIVRQRYQFQADQQPSATTRNSRVA